MIYGNKTKRHIRTVRNILNNMLYKHKNRFDTASLRTLMYEVMSFVNSRPLTYTYYLHDGELDPLTPNHLIIMKPIVTPLPEIWCLRMYMHVRDGEQFKD